MFCADSLRESGLRWEPARLEDAPNGELYLGVWCGGPGGEADADRSGRKPIKLLDLLPGVERRAGRLVAYAIALYAVAAGYVVAPWHPF